MHRRVGPGGEDNDVYVERGHCHITIPKMEVIVPLDNIRASLRSGLKRLRSSWEAPEQVHTAAPAVSHMCTALRV